MLSVNDTSVKIETIGGNFDCLEKKLEIVFLTPGRPKIIMLINRDYAVDIWIVLYPCMEYILGLSVKYFHSQDVVEYANDCQQFKDFRASAFPFLQLWACENPVTMSNKYGSGHIKLRV